MSFTAAAAELGLTQSAVSQQIRDLEDHLGRPLFHRLPRGLQLTEAGEAWAPLVTEALDRLAAGTQGIFGNRAQGLLRIRCVASFAILWLAPRLAQFRALHPQINFRLTSSIWPAEQADPAIDLEIRYGDGLWPHLDAERLTQDQMFPVCSPKLLQGEHALRSPADLAHVTLLHTFGFRGDWSQWLEHAGVASQVNSALGLEFDLAAMTVALAQNGVGVALGRTCYVHDGLAAGRLVAPFTLAIPAGDDFYLVTPKDRQASQAALAFRAWLQQTLREPSA